MRIFHKDVQWNRVATHLIHGILPGAACWLATTGNIPLALGASVFAISYLKQFVRYEENEDKWKKDEAWNDYLGSLFGFGIIAIAYSIWRLIS